MITTRVHKLKIKQHNLLYLDFERFYAYITIPDETLYKMKI